MKCVIGASTAKNGVKLAYHGDLSFLLFFLETEHSGKVTNKFIGNFYF